VCVCGVWSTHYPGKWIVSVRVRTYQQLVDDKELIVDKVVLINKDRPYQQGSLSF